MKLKLWPFILLISGVISSSISSWSLSVSSEGEKEEDFVILPNPGTVPLESLNDGLDTTEDPTEAFELIPSLTDELAASVNYVVLHDDRTALLRTLNDHLSTVGSLAEAVELIHTSRILNDNVDASVKTAINYKMHNILTILYKIDRGRWGSEKDYTWFMILAYGQDWVDLEQWIEQTREINWSQHINSILRADNPDFYKDHPDVIIQSEKFLKRPMKYVQKAVERNHVSFLSIFDDSVLTDDEDRVWYLVSSYLRPWMALEDCESKLREINWKECPFAILAADNEEFFQAIPESNSLFDYGEQRKIELCIKYDAEAYYRRHVKDVSLLRVHVDRLVKLNAAKMLKLLLRNDVSCLGRISFAEASRHYRIMNILIGEGYRRPPASIGDIVSLVPNNLKLLRMLLAKKYPSRILEQEQSVAINYFADQVATHGNIKLLKVIRPHADLLALAYIMKEAILRGHGKVIHYLATAPPGPIFPTSQDLVLAACCGHFSICDQILAINPKLMPSVYQLAAAVQEGKTDALKYFYEINNNLLPSVVGANSNGEYQLDTLQWLRSMGSELKIDEGHVDHAVITSQLNVLDFFISVSGIYPSEQSINTAAELGHVEIVQWAVQHPTRPYKISNSSFLNLLNNGHEGLANWLYEKGQGYIPSWPEFQMGVISGHLGFVRWAQSKKPGLKPDEAAIMLAMRSDRKEMVEWARAQVPKGSSSEGELV